jgi:acyl-coenzyme A thioesterase PaaI-like protein
MTAQEFFKNDLFAENAGVVLLEVRKGYSKAKLEIKPEHLNAGARTQGGAIFTLADLALAAAANSLSLSRPLLLFCVPAAPEILSLPKHANAISVEVQVAIR